MFEIEEAARRNDPMRRAIEARAQAVEYEQLQPAPRPMFGEGGAFQRGPGGVISNAPPVPTIGQIQQQSAAERLAQIKAEAEAGGHADDIASAALRNMQQQIVEELIELESGLAEKVKAGMPQEEADARMAEAIKRAEAKVAMLKGGFPPSPRQQSASERAEADIEAELQAEAAAKAAGRLK
jgi:hypothetical protein